MKNLKINYPGFLMLLVSFSSLGQISGVVKDSISGQPIPYVNIWVKSGNIGTTSGEDGSFIIAAEQNQKLIFSAVGFESKTVKVSESGKVLLKESVIKLDEVVVQSPLRQYEINIGDYTNKKFILNYACFGQPWIVAKYFSYDKSLDKTPFLKKVTLMTKSYKKGASFNLRILESNPDGTPGKEMLDENIITKVKKGKNNTVIDLSKYQIRVPENGFFIAYEFLIIDENKYKLDIQGQKEPIYNYLPTIAAVETEVETTWRYYMGAWSKMDSKAKSVKGYEDKLTELAIKITLTN